MNHSPYIVLCPGMPTNPSKQHAVVPVDEWLEVRLGRQEDYHFFSEHGDYDSAAAKRDELNREPVSMPTSASPEPGTVPLKKRGIRVTRIQATH